MDLNSLHGTNVRRALYTFPIEAYSPFRLEEGDELILGKSVGSRDGVTHLPLRIQVHYVFAPPTKSPVPFVFVPKFAESLSDVKLSPHSPTRGWGLPLAYESDPDDGLPEDDLPPHDQTLNDDGAESIVCMGSPQPDKSVVSVPDDDADSVVCTGAAPNSSQNPLLASQATQRTFGKPNTWRDVCTPEEAAAIRQSILAIPPGDDEEMGGDDTSEHLHEDVDASSEHSLVDDDDAASEHSLSDEDHVSEHSYGGYDSISEHSHVADSLCGHSHNDDAHSERSYDEDEGASDDERFHSDCVGDEAEDGGSDEGAFSEEERLRDDEIGYGDERSWPYEDSDSELSDHADEELSDRADEEEEDDEEDENEGQDAHDSDSDLVSQSSSDAEDDDEPKPVTFITLGRRPSFSAIPPPLSRPAVLREATPFYASSPNPAVIPSSMPDEEDSTQLGSTRSALVDGSVNQSSTIDGEASKSTVEGVGDRDNEAPPKGVIKGVPPAGDDSSICHSSLFVPQLYSADACRRTDLNNVAEASNSASLSRADSPCYTPSSHPGSCEGSPVPAGTWGTFALPIHLDSDSKSEAEAQDNSDWPLPLRARAFVMVPDEIEEPKFAEAEESDATMETAQPIPSELIYSIPPSPPASTGSPEAERAKAKIETVISTVPPTPPSPAYKSLAPEASTSTASSSPQSAATMDAATNTSPTSPRKRKHSALDEDEAPAASDAVPVPTNTPVRPKRQRRFGAFVKGVVFGVGIGVVSTFGALYQLGAE
jgi:hypothetical protein